MASISFSFILLLSLTISALATSPVKSGSNSLRKACDKTPEPQICVDNLSVYSTSKTASVHDLTVLSVRAASHRANGTSSLIRVNMKKLNNKTPIALQECLVNCSQGMKDTISALQKLFKAVSAKKFSDIKSLIAQIYMDTATCKNSCKGDDLVSKVIVRMADKMAKLGQITFAFANLDEKKQ